MKRLALLLALLALALNSQGELVQIGSGSLVNQGLPIEPLSIYGYSQQLYLASEIGGAGPITELSFQYSVDYNEFYERNKALKIWLGHTQRNQITAWVPVDSLSLYCDAIVPLTAFSGGLPGQGWMSITLDDPFLYDGSSNLLIAVLEDSPGHSGSTDEFLNSASTTSRGIVCRSEVPLDPNNLPASGVYVRQAFPNLRLEIAITHLTPYLPSPANAAELVPIDTSFDWSSDAGLFDFWFGTGPDDLVLVQSGLAESAFFFTEPLGLLSTYYWQVIGWHEGLSYPSPVWSFSTAGELLSPPQNFQAWWQDNEVRMSWEAPISGTVQDYLVFRNEQQLGICQATVYQDPNVAQGAVYVYYVKARNSLGQTSLPSNSGSVHIPSTEPNLILWKDFETEALWSSEIPGWTILDLDGSPTWSWDFVDFPNEGTACGWMVFAPGLTVPPLSEFQAHSGARMLMAPDALNPPDDNWLISQPLYLGAGPSLSFWARSATADYGLERLRVLISSTGSEPADFLPLHTQAWLAVPAAWTQYQYDLTAWAGQTVRFAWQSVSVDAMALFLDDLKFYGEGGYTASDDPVVAVPCFRIWPNPSRGVFKVTLEGDEFDLCVYDIRGRKICSHKALREFDGSALDLASGIYILKASQRGKSYTARLVIIK